MSIIHIPFYPSDWLAGTRGMMADETGVYITLIARMYEMAGSIERDDERLYRICGCKSKRAFAKIADYLIAEGKIQEADGELSQQRVTKEINKVVEKSTKAKAAANERWNKKPSKINTSDDADAMQTDMLGGCQPKPEPYKTEAKASTKKRATRLPDDWFLPSEWGQWAVDEFSMREVDVRSQADRFKDYWIGVGGQKGTKLNWEATWRNWIRKHIEEKGTSHGKRTYRETASAQDTARVADENAIATRIAIARATGGNQA